MFTLMECVAGMQYAIGSVTYKLYVELMVICVCAQITDDTKNVCPFDLPPGVEDDFVVNVHRHIRNLVAERDDYIDVCNCSTWPSDLLFMVCVPFAIGRRCNCMLLWLQEMRDMSVTVDDLTRAHQELQVQLLHKGADVIRSSSPEKHHMVVEVAELKSKVRRLKQEL
jgi:hypothetical protein